VNTCAAFLECPLDRSFRLGVDRGSAELLALCTCPFEAADIADGETVRGVDQGPRRDQGPTRPRKEPLVPCLIDPGKLCVRSQDGGVF
jgi:hypothetical protein